MRGNQTRRGSGVFGRRKNRFERDYIIEILKRTNGNISKAARESGLARQNFHKKILKYGVDVKDLLKRG